MVHGAGNVAGDFVERFDVAAEAFGCRASTSRQLRSARSAAT
jgi:hypothetical protein